MLLTYTPLIILAFQLASLLIIQGLTLWSIFSMAVIVHLSKRVDTIEDQIFKSEFSVIGCTDPERPFVPMIGDAWGIWHMIKDIDRYRHEVDLMLLIFRAEGCPTHASP